MKDKVKILIADDHPIMREGLKLVLEEHPEFKVVKEAQNGKDALDALLKEDFDIVTLDIEMPIMGGFDVVRNIIKLKINTKVIFLTMYKDEHIFNEAIELGALGYVLKENAVTDIIDCVKSVMNGQHYISPVLSNLILKRDRSNNELTKNNPSINDLTKTELTILKMISAGKTSKEISEELFISYKTVENHRANIAKKLDLHGTHSLIKFAISNKNTI